MEQTVASERELHELAADVAVCWRNSGEHPLFIGLHGDLGAGKTTWVRAMLRGLGHEGRVPSPTYTLMEHYQVSGVSGVQGHASDPVSGRRSGPVPDLDIVHMDLYRLEGDDELENLGLRDWLAAPRLWLLVEWPDRLPILQSRCDLLIRLEMAGSEGRSVRIQGMTERGNRALRACIKRDSNYTI